MSEELVKRLMKDEGDERQQFEATFGPFGLSRCSAPGDDLAKYEDAHMNFAWRAWNVRRAMAADRIEALMAERQWRPIETMPANHGDALLYFPERTGRGRLRAMFQISVPGMYPNRPPTHWMPLPEPPALEGK